MLVSELALGFFYAFLSMYFMTVPIDDFHQEDQVHLENDSKCINAVLEVNYKFFWRANQITRVNANILLGNLTLLENQPPQKNGPNTKVLSSSQFQELHQIFSVDFQVMIFLGAQAKRAPLVL